MFSDIYRVADEIYSNATTVMKHVDTLFKYYVILKDKIDSDRFKPRYEEKHHITDATDNIAQSYLRDYMWFDDLYVKPGKTIKVGEGDLEKLIEGMENDNP